MASVGQVIGEVAAWEAWQARAALDRPDYAEALPDASYIANALMKADESGYAAMSYRAMAETVLEALAAYRSNLKGRT